jgi:hypothetical protein
MGGTFAYRGLKEQGFALRYYRRMAINKDKIPSSVTPYGRDSFPPRGSQELRPYIEGDRFA